eukprot:CAMPEP_0196772592 /NCGR_PEP_ID=MMETSP1104-20130614/2314_1 /TAXON_ID=33652 /ORGANISM="Cafeteria sp., Strain Caron Lab Isolate" /LENGTH=174 /DNA_ID=CAMNT_0042142729 /DNA_START=149 /DNA_END=673 /DNA_ORIENTATION=+
MTSPAPPGAPPQVSGSHCSMNPSEPKSDSISRAAIGPSDPDSGRRASSGDGADPVACLDAPVLDIENCTGQPQARKGAPSAPRPGRRRGGRAEFSWDEIRRHTSPDDCWLVAHNKVYDVTAMIDSHPGGRRSILRHAGRDSTEDFDFHSTSGRKEWEPYCVGIVEGTHKSCVIS